MTKELKFWKVYFALIILNSHMWLKHSIGRVQGRWFPSLKKVWVLWYRYLPALFTQVGLLRISQTNVHFFHKQTCHSHVPAPSSSPPVSTPQSATNFHMLYLHGHWPAWDRLGRWSPKSITPPPTSVAEPHNERGPASWVASWGQLTRTAVPSTLDYVLSKRSTLIC